MALFTVNKITNESKKIAYFAFLIARMNSTQPIVIFWFRRDLRLDDNSAFYKALTSGFKVLPIFIFDTTILAKLYKSDNRVGFIFNTLEELNKQLNAYNSAIQFYHGNVLEVFETILLNYNVSEIYANHDYEPYAADRDLKVKKYLAEKGVLFKTFKDQVIFEKAEVTRPNGEPYTVFTPYSNKWIEKLKQNDEYLHLWNSEFYLYNLLEKKIESNITLEALGFEPTIHNWSKFNISSLNLADYSKTRDFPALNNTSRVSVHLRFGTVSVRKLVLYALETDPAWLNELIWREFFMQILWNFPHVIHQPFKPKYQFLNWVNDEQEFQAWTEGRTGYPLVDAGMRELNQTGFMHNRVRMVTAGFLVKHLLINWQWGESYFADKLMDFELSSNNGNWQWAAGTGCDAAPYFRIFNPVTQAEKFDPDNSYIKKWVPEFGTSSYPKPIINHDFARNRTLETYKCCI